MLLKRGKVENCKKHSWPTGYRAERGGEYLGGKAFRILFLNQCEEGCLKGVRGTWFFG